MPYLSCKKIENDVYNFPTWQYCKYKDIFDSRIIINSTAKFYISISYQKDLLSIDTRIFTPSIRASKKQGQIVKMHLLFWHIWGVSYKLECVNPRKRYPESGIPHTIRAKSIHQVLPMLSECASKNSFYICIVIPTRKDSSPGTRSRSPPWPSMIFRTEESPIP